MKQKKIQSDQYYNTHKLYTVSLIETLEHIEPKYVKEFVKDAYNCLNDKRIFILTPPSENQKLCSKHFQHFTVEKLNELIGNKFTIIQYSRHIKSGLEFKIWKLLRFFADKIYPNLFYQPFLQYFNKNSFL